ncbi:Uncharacterized protein HZ326_12735 [Fusarium oxysporum f. sp. albedinis]|nr:Uncharacterized protein HZ326_12735 [Fusarium oxysporum f. sp. albedinis]
MTRPFWTVPASVQYHNHSVGVELSGRQSSISGIQIERLDRGAKHAARIRFPVPVPEARMHRHGLLRHKNKGGKGGSGTA